MMDKVIILLSLISNLISYTFGKGTYDGCLFELTDTNGMTAEYDLSYFNLDSEYSVFTVIDAQNTYFKYQFNICGAINSQLWAQNTTIPAHCKHPQSQHGPCISSSQQSDTNVLKCDNYEVTTGKIPSAVQVDTKNNVTQCYWLGMEVESSTTLAEYKKELLYPDDAGKGVIFTILNGEWCENVGRNRELRVKLECPDDKRIEFQPGIHTDNIESSVVEEIDTCIYELAVVSPLACPNKCVSRMNLDMYAVCATHGICEADPYGNGEELYPNGTIRCLCDEGYQGDICEEVNTEIKIIDQTHPGLLAAIIICIILLGVAIVCAAVLCHKIRMKELEDRGGIDNPLSDGMLTSAADANLQQMKTDAMTMNIGIDDDGNELMGATSTTNRTGGSVQLQNIDDQVETDKTAEANELLQDDDDDDEEFEEDDGGNNDDDKETATDKPGDDNEETNPGAED